MNVDDWVVRTITVVLRSGYCEIVWRKRWHVFPGWLVISAVASLPTTQFREVICKMETGHRDR
jgi:hypothetical protein